MIPLMWFPVDLHLYAFVGVIMLVGLVKKNGIMMIDFAIESRRNHAKTAAAAGEASARALPIPTDCDPWPGKTNA